MTRCRRFEAALPALLLAIAGASARADIVKGPEPCVPAGRVASLTGPAATTRARVAHDLGCGEDVCSGDSVSTGAGSSLGLLTGGMLIQLGEQSSARVVLTAEGTPQVQVERGRVRVIDPREGGPPGRLAVLESHAEISGNDTEAELVGEGSERSARFCEFAAPLRLNGGTLAPGTCAAAQPGSALVATAAPTGGPSLAALDAACAPAPTIPSMAYLEPLPTVAAGPPNVPPLPGPFDGPLRSPCDVPGSGCTGGISVVEQPPAPDPFPGGR